MDFGLRGRTIVITGGASGIGLAAALAAARQGAHVAVCDIDAQAAQAAADLVRAEGVRALALPLDVTDEVALEEAGARVRAELGVPDGLIASAGISRAEAAEDLSDEIWDAVIGVNLTGVFLACQTIGRQMISRGRGSIVTIASLDALGGHAGRAHYCASKHGVVGLTMTLALEWGRLGVRVNAVAPGAVDTPLLRGGVPAEFIDGVLLDRTPLARLSTAEDQAMACLFLLSDAAAYVNGAVLPVDGGISTGYFTRWNGADYASNVLLARGVYEQR